LTGQCKFDGIYFVFFFPPQKKKEKPPLDYILAVKENQEQLLEEILRSNLSKIVTINRTN
jgi:hypothetical protein